MKRFRIVELDAQTGTEQVIYSSEDEVWTLQILAHLQTASVGDDRYRYTFVDGKS